MSSPSGAALALAAALLAPLCAAPAQTAADQAAAVEAFKKLDGSGNGYLSGTEIEQCRCREYDADGDGRITALEYLTGRGALPGAAAARPGTPPPSTQPAARPAPRPAAVPRPAAEAGGGWAAGAPIEVNRGERGRWYPAVLLRAEAGRYFVHYEEYSSAMDEWVEASLVRQSPQRARHRTGSGGPVPTGRYACYSAAGGSLRFQGEFTVTGAGSYVDGDGVRGTFAKDAAGIVRFSGGAFGGSQGDFQYTSGQANIYMHTPSKPGTRAGMDCEGPTP